MASTTATNTINGCNWPSIWLQLTLYTATTGAMGWLRLVGSIKFEVSFVKEPYKRYDILQKRPIILSILLTVSTPYVIRDFGDLAACTSHQTFCTATTDAIYSCN